MSAARLSRWARWFVGFGALALVAWNGAATLGAPRRATVTIALYGFVLSTVFGKAYSLVPTYFDREIAFSRAPTVHLPLAVLGTIGLAAGPLGAPAVVETAGAVAWGLGVAVFLGTMAWTVRDNPTGAATGTSDANADRRPIDRAANAFMPVALSYFGFGAYETVAAGTALPSVVGPYAPAVSHLLAAGGAAVLLFAVGFRLLPRFMVAHPPKYLVGLVLPTGAVGPLLIAAGITGGPVLVAGAIVESLAVVGFAVAVLTLYFRSDRRRVGFYGVAAGAVAGVAGVSLGLQFALVGRSAALIPVHYRLNLLGFLGLTILGVAYQFYPPNVGRFPGASDRTAVASMAAIALGLVVEAAGHVLDLAAVVTGGRALALLGSLLYAGLLLGVFYDRYRR